MPITVPVLAFSFSLANATEALAGVALGLANTLMAIAVVPLYVRSASTFAFIALVRMMLASGVAIMVMGMGASPAAAISGETVAHLLCFAGVKIWFSTEAANRLNRFADAKSILKRLSGFFSATISGAIYAQITKICLVAVVSLVLLAQYFLAMILVSVGSQLNYMVSVVVAPKIRERLQEKKSNITSYIWKIWMAVTVAALLAAVVGWWIINALIPNVIELDRFDAKLAFLALLLMVAKASNVWGVVLTIVGEVKWLNVANIASILMVLMAFLAVIIFPTLDKVATLMVVESLTSLLVLPYLAFYYSLPKTIDEDTDTHL